MIFFLGLVAVIAIAYAIIWFDHEINHDSNIESIEEFRKFQNALRKRG